MSDERLTAEEVAAEMQRAHLFLPFLLGLRLEELGREFELHDTIGPLFHPSAWMKNRVDVERNQAIVKALARAQREIRKVLPDYEAWRSKQVELEEARR